MISMILLYAITGYLFGSILFSKLFCLVFHKQDSSENSCDHNPGVFNAFKNGGFWCGLFALIGDLAKGFLPIFFYCLHHPLNYAFPILMAAPVVGHLYPLFYHFKGGKGITTTFGVLLALWAAGISSWPVWSLAILFLFFKLVIDIKPDLYATALVYALLPVIVWFEPVLPLIDRGIVLITLNVLVKLVFSREQRGKTEVRFLWMH